MLSLQYIAIIYLIYINTTKEGITDYLEACGTSDHQHKDKLLAMRLHMRR